MGGPGAEGAALNPNSVLIEHRDREGGSQLSSGEDGCSNSVLKEEGHTWQESTCRCPLKRQFSRSLKKRGSSFGGSLSIANTRV